MTDDLTNRLVDWVEFVRQRAAGLARRHALPPTISQRARRVIIQKPGTWSADSVFVAVSGWRDHRLLAIGGDVLQEEGMERATALARKVVTEAGTSLPFFSPFLGHGIRLAHDGHASFGMSYSTDAATWVVGHMLLPFANAYLDGLTSLEEPDLSLSNRLADELVGLATATTIRSITQIAFSGLMIDEQLTASSWTIRALEPEEIGTLFDPSTLASNPHRSWLHPPTHALELSMGTPKQVRPRANENEIWGMIIALQLHGFELCGERASSWTEPAWAFPWNSPLRVPLGVQGGESKLITADQFTQCVLTATQAAAMPLSKPTTSAALSLHRFALGCSRPDDVDAILDFVIALECLLLPYDASVRTTELSYRFRTHGALYLGTTPEARRQISADLSELYGLRSRLVHGSRHGYPDQSTLATGRDRARALAAQGLRRAVHGGFPTADQFRDIVLGSPGAPWPD